MTSQNLSLDALLSAQSTSHALVTIESIDSRDDVVKVTPWSESGGCQCDWSVLIKRSQIESVTPSGQTHHCCGKRLQVVSINFHKNASLDPTEFLGQLSAASARSTNPVSLCGQIYTRCTENCGPNNPHCQQDCWNNMMVCRGRIPIPTPFQF
jgi:hypothetical protein